MASRVEATERGGRLWDAPRTLGPRTVDILGRGGREDLASVGGPGRARVKRRVL